MKRFNSSQRLKKLAALLDVSQGEIIKKALEIYEKFLFQKSLKTKSESVNKEVQKILKESLLQLWEQDPERKALDLKLMANDEDFDECIVDNWSMEFIN